MKSPQVIIRAAVAEDVPHIAELITPFVAERKLLPRSEQELLELTRNGFVAVDGERIVGFAAVEVYSKKLAEVQCLAVCQTRQREGIGKRLVRQCIRRSRELNVLELMAISASEAFLRDCGFDYSLPEQKRALFYQPRTDPPEDLD
jgi:amino-acid N-acetyltransferase